MIVLGIAAALLIIVGFLGYRDWVKANAEKKISEANQKIDNLEKQVSELALKSQGQTQQEISNRRDPELEKIRAELLAMKTQAEQNSMLMEKVLDRTDPPKSTSSDPSSFLPPIPEGILNPPGSELAEVKDEVEIPDSLRNALNNPPGGPSAELKKMIQEEEERIAKIPAIGKVVHFDKDWNIVTIDAGRQNNLQKGSRYAIRRGRDLLGKIKIEEVHDNHSIAVMVTGNTKIAGALVPEAGDLVVAANPF